MTTEVENTMDKKRQQMTSILGINISPERCSTHIKKNLYCEEVDGRIHQLRTILKTGEDNDERVKAQQELMVLSQKVIRICNETSTVIAVICDNMVTLLPDTTR